MCIAVNIAASVYFDRRSLWSGFCSSGGSVFLSDDWRSAKTQASDWDLWMATESRAQRESVCGLLRRMTWRSVFCLFYLQSVWMKSSFTHMTAAQHDDWERLTLWPAAPLYSSGACFTLVIEFFVTHCKLWHDWCIQPIRSAIWEWIGWILTAMTSSSSMPFSSILGIPIREGQRAATVMFAQQSISLNLALKCHSSFHSITDLSSGQ